MQYIFKENSGEKQLTLDGELYKYIAKVRRYKVGDIINFRNLQDDILYSYEIVNITKKEINLDLKDKNFKKNLLQKDLEIFWCIIDIKTVEKTLPFLNQIGVKKITFIYCDRSQKNFKLDFSRLKKIVISSNQQCGRVHIMEFEQFDKLIKVIKQNQDLSVLDFGGDSDFTDIKKVLIGCEGGFSDDEKELLKNQKKIAFSTQNILKSETAAVAISSKLLI